MNVKKKSAVKLTNHFSDYELAVGGLQPISYLLKLYVTGLSPVSIRAIENIKAICEEHLKGSYTLEVIDLYKNPNLAEGEQIIAAPTLLKKLPLPLRRIIGDMSNEERVLVGLDLRKTDSSSNEKKKRKT
jgi:circadian clock protein KaiB